MLIAVCSLKASPGVTTFSLALAARWPGDVRRVVVECDPAGGDLAARMDLPYAPGLVSLAAAARGDSDPDLLWRHTSTLPGGLAVVPAPPSTDRMVLTALAGEDGGVLRRATRASGVVAVADCGRIGPDSPAVPIVRAADSMLLLVRPRVDELAHLLTQLRIVERWSPRSGLLLVGPGHSVGEVQRELGVPVMALVPWDPRGAAVLSGHRRSGRGPHRSALGRAAATVAKVIATGRTDHHLTPEALPPAPLIGVTP